MPSLVLNRSERPKLAVQAEELQMLNFKSFPLTTQNLSDGGATFRLAVNLPPRLADKSLDSEKTAPAEHASEKQVSCDDQWSCKDSMSHLKQLSKLQASEADRTIRLNAINDDPMNKLYFDASLPVQLNSHVGTDAFLRCRLRKVQEVLRVSWVKGLNILTTGDLRYTNDER